MKVKDLLESVRGDIDVYDDATEELGVAWCGVQLTCDGLREYADVLKLDCHIIVDSAYTRAIIHVESDKQLARARDMFESMAGNCECEKYARYFKEEA